MVRRDLYLYNTATRAKEKFVPAHDPVGMYCCGPTVYNFAHVGNLRTYIFEDVLKRVLGMAGYRVKHVMNITDVGHLTSDADTGDDKMEKGAAREGKSVWEIAAFYTKNFFENTRALNILDPDICPKATDHIPQMIAMIGELEKGGFTYTTSDGVYFDTTRFAAYCNFAGLDPSSLRAGERVDMGEKRAVTDFALWKFSPSDVKRAMEWESPWGTGFPGWHIECSAMSLACLPQPLDIHCGGQDHVRVHHTNEIAQSEAATGRRFANYWCHGEFLVIDKGKMAKSGGNFITLDSVKEEGIDPLAYRMFCFSAHYRSPVTFSWESLAGAAHGLAALKSLVGEAVARAGENREPFTDDQVEEALGPFYAALCDDLNMPKAVAAVWDLMHRQDVTGPLKVAAVKRADLVLALDLLTPQKDESAATTVERDGIRVTIVAEGALGQVETEMIASRIAERRAARKAKDFARADRIRGELTAKGYEVKDFPDGSAEVRRSDKQGG